MVIWQESSIIPTQGHIRMPHMYQNLFEFRKVLVWSTHSSEPRGLLAECPKLLGTPDDFEKDSAFSPNVWNCLISERRKENCLSVKEIYKRTHLPQLLNRHHVLLIRMLRSDRKKLHSAASAHCMIRFLILVHFALQWCDPSHSEMSHCLSLEVWSEQVWVKKKKMKDFRDKSIPTNLSPQLSSLRTLGMPNWWPYDDYMMNIQ